MRHRTSTALLFTAVTKRRKSMCRYVPCCASHSHGFGLSCNCVVFSWGMVSGYVCTLPQRTGIIPLVADRSIENHEALPMKQQARPPEHVLGQIQTPLWEDVTGPDQLLLALCVRTEQRHHLPSLHIHLSGSLGTHACKTCQQQLLEHDYETDSIWRRSNSIPDKSNDKAIQFSYLLFHLFPHLWECISP